MSDETEQSEEVVDAESEKLYSAKDVASIFRVSTKTVMRWTKPGGEFEQRNVQVLTTIGGHRRFFAEEIHQLFQLMLEGKLYDDNDAPDRSEKPSTSRIAGLPKPAPRDPRFE
jgi:hypothetical protein